MNEINKSIKTIYKSIKKGGKVFLCGNGGSAADAQHLAAEYIVRLRPKENRRPLPVLYQQAQSKVVGRLMGRVSIETATI